MNTTPAYKPSITIHVEKKDKAALAELAYKNGLQLVPFCRMVLLHSLKDTRWNS